MFLRIRFSITLVSFVCGELERRFKMNCSSFNILLLDRGQWAIINECRGGEDVLIKREEFSFAKNSADEGRGKSVDGWPLRRSYIWGSELGSKRA
jgi:hypothetical protein